MSYTMPCVMGSVRVLLPYTCDCVYSIRHCHSTVCIQRVRHSLSCTDRYSSSLCALRAPFCVSRSFALVIVPYMYNSMCYPPHVHYAHTSISTKHETRFPIPEHPF